MEDRKARIAALRAKAGRPNPVTAGDEGAPQTKEPVLQVLALSNSSETAPPSTKKQKGLPDEKKESILIKALRQAQAEAKNSSLTGTVEDMAPKKINADLKREIQPKLDKLAKRTQKAIVALLRERLEKEAAAEIDD